MYYIFLLYIIQLSFGYIYIHIIENGGYEGYFCLEQKEINDDNFKCNSKMNNCQGYKSKLMEKHLPKNHTLYNGYKYQCKLKCNFNTIYNYLSGDFNYKYVFLNKNLLLNYLQQIVINNETFYAKINNLNLISSSDLKIEFENIRFSCFNVKIIGDGDSITCDMYYDGVIDYNSKFWTRAYVIYGFQLNCVKKMYLGNVAVINRDYDKLMYMYEKILEANQSIINYYNQFLKIENDLINATIMRFNETIQNELFDKIKQLNETCRHYLKNFNKNLSIQIILLNSTLRELIRQNLKNKLKHKTDSTSLYFYGAILVPLLVLFFLSAIISILILTINCIVC